MEAQELIEAVCKRLRVHHGEVLLQPSQLLLKLTGTPTCD
jgi:hypothetical protein